jgi:hypothetical protein
MNNSHLIPDIIKDTVRKLLTATSANERHNYTLQVKAIADLCTAALAKTRNNEPVPKAKKKAF